MGPEGDAPGRRGESPAPGRRLESHAAAAGPGPQLLGRVRRTEIALVAGEPDFAVTHRAAIEAHWQRRLAANPALFNGPVLVFEAVEIAGDCLRAQARRTGFATLLAMLDWHDVDSGLFNLFGAAAVLSSDGALLLGRMGHWTAQPGAVKCVGGTPDDSDITAAGQVDIAGSVARECAEETGLVPPPGAPSFVVSRDGPLLALVAELPFAEAAAALVAAAEAHIAADPDPEIDAIVVLRHIGDADGLAVPPYNRVVLPLLLPA